MNPIDTEIDESPVANSIADGRNLLRQLSEIAASRAPAEFEESIPDELTIDLLITAGDLYVTGVEALVSIATSLERLATPPAEVTERRCEYIYPGPDPHMCTITESVHGPGMKHEFRAGGG